MQAAQDLADELEGLSDDERTKLKQSLDELYRDGPQTQVAGLRFKRIMSKVGAESYSAMREIIIGVASETLRKTLFGGS